MQRKFSPFKLPLSRFFLSMSLVSVAITAFAAGSPVLPPALKKLEKEGVQFVDAKIPAPSGMTGWAGFHGQQPLAFYVASDGKVIVGTQFDANGNDITSAPLMAAVKGAMTGGVWNDLTNTSWIVDGKASAPKVVYVFTDANCPYCNKFWSEARPWVKAGKVQLRHIMVGIITPDSGPKAAAIMASKDPSKALEDHEAARAAAGKKSPAMNHALDIQGIAALQNIPPAIQQKLDGNMKVMFKMGLQGTPAIIWRDDKGEVKTAQGVPASLKEVFGPL